MDRREIEQELRALTRKQLLVLASEAGVVGRHGMKKDALVEALMLPRIYKSLPESPGILDDLSRGELLQLCELAGKKVGGKSKRADLIRELEGGIRGAKTGPGTKKAGRAGRGPRTSEQSFTRDGVEVGDSPVEPGSPPESGAESRVVLLPVHPYLVHVYWEVASVDVERARKRLGSDRSRRESVLRFFDVSMPAPDGASEHDFFDVEVELEAGQWYVDLWSPEKSYYVDLGLKTGRGRFVSLCRSRVVRTPPAWPSAEEAERHVRLNDDGELVEVEVAAEDRLPGPEVLAAARPSAEDSADDRRIRERDSEIQQMAVGEAGPAGLGESRAVRQRGQAAERGPHSPGAGTATSATSGPDLTELCERTADLGASPGSRLWARRDDVPTL